MTEYEKMLAGLEHDSSNDELELLRQRAASLYYEYNKSGDRKLLKELFKQDVESLIVRRPFFCDYGHHISLGKNVYFNFNCVILDCARVSIGNNVFFAPNVQIYTAQHPISDIPKRNDFVEIAKEISIGNNCWIGGNVVILAGVEIGDNCTIGAGSVVTKSIPPNSVAVGNPCRVIRSF